MVAQGVYVGNSPSALQDYDKWMGHSATNVLNALNQSSWSAFDSSIPYEINEWKNASEKLILGVPLVVDGATLSQAAAHAYDSHYLAAAKALAAGQSGTGPIYVRTGWEFNGDWMPWAAQGHEADFIKAYQNLVDAFRSVSDRFRFVWDVNIGQNMDPATAYPGDKYVDVVGMDAYYNSAWDSADPAKAFSNFVSMKYGLQWQQDFAAAHGKPTAISEWGVEGNNTGPLVTSMAKWMNDHNMVYENYWNSNDAYPGRLDQGQYPDTAKAYLAAFGSTPVVSSTTSASAALTTSSTPTTQAAQATAASTANATVSSTPAATAAAPVDHTPPPTPGAPSLAAASDTGTSSSDGVTQARSLTFTGVTEAGATVTLRDGTSIVGVTTAGATGAYAVTSAALADGHHVLTVTATDAAGNTSAASAGKTVLVDTMAPGLSIATRGVTTKKPTVTVGGSGEAGATVVLTDNGKWVGSTTIDGNGNWASAFRFVNRGANSIVATEYDAAGNASAGSIAFRATSTSLAKLATAAASMPSSSFGAMSASGSNASSASMLAGAHR